MPVNPHPPNHRRPARIYLAEWIKYRGLTAEKLAGQLGTSKSVISKLVNGRQRYHQDWLERIAYALDCNVRDLYRPPRQSEIERILDGMSAHRLDSVEKVLREFSSMDDDE